VKVTGICSWQLGTDKADKCVIIHLLTFCI